MSRKHISTNQPAAQRLQPAHAENVSAERAPVARRTTSPVQQARYRVPSPPPVEGEVIYEGVQDGTVVHEGAYHGDVVYEGAVIDNSCDAMGSCGCDAMGCDAIGNCGPSCGCSMCGEIPSGRAWRPALTLSLPQDGWLSVEALHLWQDGMYLPPLLTTSPTGTARTSAGVLTRPGTTVLYGANEALEDPFDGFRLRFGFWLDRCHTVGVGGEYFKLDQEFERFSITSTGDPIVARPFFNTNTGFHDSELIGFTGVISGTATVNVNSELDGGGFYIRKLTCCSEGCRKWLFCGCKEHYCTRSEVRLGYRYLELSEGVTLREELVSTDTAAPGSFDITDSFNTVNQFNGVDIAWAHRINRGYWTLDGLFRIAVGNTNQRVNISGTSTIVDGNNAPQTFNQGFLALDSNIGNYEQDQFSVVPELNLNLGYQLTDHLKAMVGYTGIYWSNVVRPGHHIPTQINPQFLPPPLTNPVGDPQPLFAFDTTDYWAHGITYGLEYRW